MQHLVLKLLRFTASPKEGNTIKNLFMRCSVIHQLCFIIFNALSTFRTRRFNRAIFIMSNLLKGHLPS